jgi:hypothetical protein
VSKLAKRNLLRLFPMRLLQRAAVAACGCCGVARPGRSGHGFRSGMIVSDAVVAACGCCGVARPGRSGHGFRSGILLAKILHNIWRKMLYQKFGYEAVIVAWPSRQRGHCFLAADETWLS